MTQIEKECERIEEDVLYSSKVTGSKPGQKPGQACVSCINGVSSTLCQGSHGYILRALFTT